MTEPSKAQSEPAAHAITRALHGVAGGDADARERLWQLTYDELHRLAGRLMNRERAGHTLAPADLIGELWMKLADQDRIEWRDRAHFYGVASKACRRILIDYARKHRAQKRGAGVPRVTIDRLQIAADNDVEAFIALDEAMEELKDVDPRLYQVVDLRYFGDLSEEETALALDVSPRTVRRDWVKAKGWLLHHLSPQATDGRPLPE